MAQQEDLEFLRTVAAREQQDQCEKTTRDDVNERDEHRRPPWTGAPTLPGLRPAIFGTDDRVGAPHGAADFPNVSFVEGDVTHLPPDLGEFDLVGSLRTIHHVRRTELAFAELPRVTRPGGLVLVVDQVAPADPLVALELDRFERARDPTHQHTLADADFRHFFEANELRCLRTDFVLETRDLERYLDLAACEGEERERVRALAPGASFPVTVGWYLLRR
jgi:SAM-dependent methyltransferase